MTAATARCRPRSSIISPSSAAIARPGFVNQAQVLVETLALVPIPRAEVETAILRAMDGHICRCTGYVRYYAALRALILADPRLTR